MPTLDRLCFSCDLSIDDPYYLMIADQTWHLSCLKCFICGLALADEQTCFVKQGRILCKDDYIKCINTRESSSQTCARCQHLIQPDDTILRAEGYVFHMDCFTCVACDAHLHSGDEFGIQENLIYCRDHFLEQNGSKFHDDSGYQTSPSEAYKSKKFQYETFSCSSYFVESDDNQSDKSYYGKQKRLRTSFKHHQLRFMRSYFNINHNPDAKDLKNLSEKTNLPKRVLQVWFQNARAKYRRSHILSNDDRTNFYQSETCSSST